MLKLVENKNIFHHFQRFFSQSWLRPLKTLFYLTKLSWQWRSSFMSFKKVLSCKKYLSTWYLYFVKKLDQSKEPLISQEKPILVQPMGSFSFDKSSTKPRNQMVSFEFLIQTNAICLWWSLIIYIWNVSVNTLGEVLLW